MFAHALLVYAAANYRNNSTLFERWEPDSNATRMIDMVGYQLLFSNAVVLGHVLSSLRLVGVTPTVHRLAFLWRWPGRLISHRYTQVLSELVYLSTPLDAFLDAMADVWRGPSSHHVVTVLLALFANSGAPKPVRCTLMVTTPSPHELLCCGTAWKSCTSAIRVSSLQAFVACLCELVPPWLCLGKVALHHVPTQCALLILCGDVSPYCC